ncbi:chromate efflux transporter [Staphylococcus pseudoxylosus]|uniref:Chromate efflux transporter n=1 Tax=Staphylococcus pseudoxylosus TaxID=2282419 RepID=A0AAQ0MIP5_9STAP|nr:chromate efflux transporter [Staphylococcus pseudoxylosus]RMI85524.1 chromate efflux transporter [Staphylococcus pseudoxylosus]
MKYLEVFLVALRLGCTSFGGPTAHLGYFYDEYVKRRQWLTEQQYTNLVALCQFLPGPASSQVGFGIGITKAGLIGGVISFIGFTLPSVIVLMLCATLLLAYSNDLGWTHGLKLVAVAIVLNAIIGMGQKLLPDLKTKILALFTLVVAITVIHPLSQLGALIVVAIVGLALFKETDEQKSSIKIFNIPRIVGAISLILFFSLLLILPILNFVTHNSWINMIDNFYRSGALVFGGGHVVLPLLEQSFVATDMISANDFLSGYALTQAVPGPLFTFAAYIGTVMSGVTGGIVATIAIFLPAFLLLVGVLPFWEHVQSNRYAKSMLKAISAGVVGILIAAFYNPIFTSSVNSNIDFAFAATLFVLLAYCKTPSWLIVILGLLLGLIFY